MADLSTQRRGDASWWIFRLQWWPTSIRRPYVYTHYAYSGPWDWPSGPKPTLKTATVVDRAVTVTAFGQTARLWMRTRGAPDG